MTTMNDTLIDVPSASLRYRLAGQPSDLPLLVFENGWGASFEQWAWIERLLAPRTRLLFYDRAGIGDSRLHAPQTLAGLSSGLVALLGALGIDAPVVVIGHSYGGLMSSLHLAQQPRIVRALIQIDPTPDGSDPTIDAQLKTINIVGKLSIMLARLGLPNPAFAPAGKMLPAVSGAQLMTRAFGSAASLKAAMTEIGLLDEIRSMIARESAGCPTLVISAGKASAPTGLMARLVPPRKVLALLECMQALHRQQAARASPGVWDALPHDHGELVFSEAGAAATSARILSYVRTL